jgi:hypothetical protein
VDDEGLVVAAGRLWDETWRHVAIEQFERRLRIAKVKPGWYDAGILWQESNSHSAAVLGLADLLICAAMRMCEAERARVEAQVKVGCDYLVATQTRAADLGRPDGAMVHDLLGLQHMAMVPDAAKAAAALARAANALPEADGDRRAKYRTAAARALNWALSAEPAGGDGFVRRPHGVDEQFVPPKEHRTSDLLMLCWAAVELARGGHPGMRPRAVELARQVLARQVPREKAEDGIFGHFYTFASGTLTEKAWTHTGARHANGADNGQTFPQYVLPLVEMLRLWPEDADAPRWRQALHDYAYGFVLPACRLSPFLILPLGYYAGAGWLHFAALWHGMNAVYPLAAALALELGRLFGDGQLREIAVANLQWIAGLNAGLTAEAQALGCHMFSMDVPPGVALPVSMIRGIGRRSAGCWTTIRGSICNGFAAGDQFRLDVEPTRANDGPHALHDEDWITHAGGWLSGIARLGDAAGG